MNKGISITNDLHRHSNACCRQKVLKHIIVTLVSKILLG